jgi:uncharacterized OB-fold protein
MTGEGDERPRPRIGPDSAPFWAAASEGTLALPTCEACGKAHLPPGPVCPFCLSDRIVWKAAAGTGVISTFTVVHKAWFPAFADRTPYAVVQVELDEGPRLTAGLSDEADGPPAIGQRVSVTFERVDGDLALPMFRRI